MRARVKVCRCVKSAGRDDKPRRRPADLRVVYTSASRIRDRATREKREHEGEAPWADQQAPSLPYLTAEGIIQNTY